MYCWVCSQPRRQSSLSLSPCSPRNCSAVQTAAFRRNRCQNHQKPPQTSNEKCAFGWVVFFCLFWFVWFGLYWLIDWSVLYILFDWLLSYCIVLLICLFVWLFCLIYLLFVCLCCIIVYFVGLFVYLFLGCGRAQIPFGWTR